MAQERIAPQRNRQGRVIGTGRTAKETTAETERQKKEAAHKPWREKWEKVTGKKYGIATAAAYNKWLGEQRKKAAAAKAAGSTARKQGEAIAPTQTETGKKKKKE